MSAVTDSVVSFFFGGVIFVGIFYAYAKYSNTTTTGLSNIPLLGITFIANLLPFSLLSYGFAGDLINQEFLTPRLSTPSIAALLSMLLIGISTQGYAMTQGIDLSAQDTSGQLWCTIPGMENLESPWIPTAFVSTATIASYYLYWAWHTNRPYRNLLITFSVVLFIQLVSFNIGQCSDSYKPLLGRGGTIINIFVAIILGAIAALIAFLSTSIAGGLKYDPFPTSTTAKSAEPGPPPGGTTGGNFTGGTSQKLSGDENVFVAELYKDGKLVTESIV